MSSSLPLEKVTNGDSTPLLQDWLGDDQAKRFRREVHFPTGRFGEAIEQAHAVVFLASDESSFVNGTDFVVDGGMTKVGADIRWLLSRLQTDIFRRTSLRKDLRRHRRRTWLDDSYSGVELLSKTVDRMRINLRSIHRPETY